MPRVERSGRGNPLCRLHRGTAELHGGDPRHPESELLIPGKMPYRLVKVIMNVTATMATEGTTFRNAKMMATRNRNLTISG